MYGVVHTGFYVPQQRLQVVNEYEMVLACSVEEQYCMHGCKSSEVSKGRVKHLGHFASVHFRMLMSVQYVLRPPSTHYHALRKQRVTNPNRERITSQVSAVSAIV